MLNVYEQVDRNRRRSSLVLISFVVFVGLFFWLVGQLLGSSWQITILAIFLSLLSALGSYYWGDRVVLAATHAQPARRDQYPNFYRAAENLAIAAQIPVPRLYVINTPAMNAFATGRDPHHAIICATRGLLENLNQSELEAVIGHETGHIINYDIRLMTIVAVLVGGVVLLSDWILRGGLALEDDDNHQNRAWLFLLGLFFLLFAPLAAKLIQLAISRRREFLADAMAVKFTRQPRAMISALKKIASHSSLPTSPALAHLFIANPRPTKPSWQQKIASLFATHPPLEARLAALEKML